MSSEPSHPAKCPESLKQGDVCLVFLSEQNQEVLGSSRTLWARSPAALPSLSHLLPRCCRRTGAVLGAEGRRVHAVSARARWGPQAGTPGQRPPWVAPRTPAPPAGTCGQSHGEQGQARGATAVALDHGALLSSPGIEHLEGVVHLRSAFSPQEGRSRNRLPPQPPPSEHSRNGRGSGTKLLSLNLYCWEFLFSKLKASAHVWVERG